MLVSLVPVSLWTLPKRYKRVGTCLAQCRAASSWQTTCAVPWKTYAAERFLGGNRKTSAPFSSRLALHWKIWLQPRSCLKAAPNASKIVDIISTAKKSDAAEGKSVVPNPGRG